MYLTASSSSFSSSAPFIHPSSRRTVAIAQRGDATSSVSCALLLFVKPAFFSTPTICWAPMWAREQRQVSDPHSLVNWVNVKHHLFYFKRPTSWIRREKMSNQEILRNWMIIIYILKRNRSAFHDCLLYNFLYFILSYYHIPSSRVPCCTRSSRHTVQESQFFFECEIKMAADRLSLSNANSLAYHPATSFVFFFLPFKPFSLYELCRPLWP